MQPQFLLSGLAWPESPRWFDDALWFSDVHNFKVKKVRPDGEVTVVADVPGRPGGLGFMPDGRLLVAGALDKKLWWVRRDGSLVQAADLSGHVRGLLNDMIVDASGRAWVGDTGFDLLKGEEPRPGALLTWSESDGVRIAADDVMFPNGLALDHGERTLYLAETFGQCVTAFDVDDSGNVSNRRRLAALQGRPDGLCLDSDGALWVPLLWDGEFHRVGPDGCVLERLVFPGQRAISCTLGGADRRTLYLGVCKMDDSDKSNILREGSIQHLRVAVSGAGIP